MVSKLVKNVKNGNKNAFEKLILYLSLIIIPISQIQFLSSKCLI